MDDVEVAVAALRSAAGLRPFLRFELALGERLVPIALFMIGSTTLELVGVADRTQRAGGARIRRVRVESKRARAATEMELGPGCALRVDPGRHTRLIGIAIETPAVEADGAWLRGIGAEPVGADSGGGEQAGAESAVDLRLGTTAVELVACAGGALPPGGEFVAGWHRIGVACRDVDATVARFEESGLAVLTPAYRVMPGLREAMLYLPSGLVVQPVSQTLWKMLPVITCRKVRSVLTRKPIRFIKTTGGT